MATLEKIIRQLTALGIIMQTLCSAHLEICGIMQTPELSGVEGIKTLVGISQERNVHLWNFISDLAGGLGSLEVSGRISLVDLVNGEVCGIDIGHKPWFKWRTNTTKTIKIDAAEERMSLDFVCSTSAKAILRVTNQTKKMSVTLRLFKIVAFTFGSDFQPRDQAGYHLGNEEWCAN